MADYDIGDKPTVFITFSDADGDPADPGEVALVYRKPDGEVVTLGTSDLTHAEVGSGYYEYEIEIDQHGVWYGEWRGSAGLEAVEPWSLTVRRSKVRDPGGFTPEP